MFKFLIILTLIIYVIYKLGSLFFRAGVSSQSKQRYYRKPSDGNINVEHNGGRHKGNDFKGGEYIDYEEVK
ncbi:MAG: DUF4834 family protein [Flammeovirgaceae bacterium]|nr:DUF4834 family protein [Flammeovirgaceae bacterium]